jgi:hypothetical protein
MYPYYNNNKIIKKFFKDIGHKRKIICQYLNSSPIPQLSNTFSGEVGLSWHDGS